MNPFVSRHPNKIGLYEKEEWVQCFSFKQVLKPHRFVSQKKLNLVSESLPVSQGSTFWAAASQQKDVFFSFFFFGFGDECKEIDSESWKIMCYK